MWRSYDSPRELYQRYFTGEMRAASEAKSLKVPRRVA
jgi:hypothetical protein